jgi:hypothetical protein
MYSSHLSKSSHCANIAFTLVYGRVNCYFAHVYGGLRPNALYKVDFCSNTLHFIDAPIKYTFFYFYSLQIFYDMDGPNCPCSFDTAGSNQKNQIGLKSKSKCRSWALLPDRRSVAAPWRCPRGPSRRTSALLPYPERRRAEPKRHHAATMAPCAGWESIMEVIGGWELTMEVFGVRYSVLNVTSFSSETLASHSSSMVQGESQIRR